MITSTARYSEIENRLDAEYYKPYYLESLKLLWNRFEKRSILDLFKYVKGYAFESAYYRNEGVGVYRVTDIHNGTDFSKVVKVPENFWNKYKKFQLQPRDMVITVTSTVGLSFLLPEEIPRLLMNQNAMFLRSKGNLSTEFLFAFTQTKHFQNLVYRITHLGTRPFLGLEFFRSVTIPNINEEDEQKVKNLVRNSYKKYELAKQKYEEARQLLNDFLEIKEDEFSFKNTFSLPFSKMEDRLDGEFYQPKYYKLLNILKNKDTKTIKEIKTFNKRGIQPNYIKKSQYKVLTSKYILDRYIDYSALPFISKQFFNNSQNAQLKYSDIVTYTTGAYVGRTQIWIEKEIPAIASNHVNILRVKNVNPVYVGFLLNSFVGQLQFQRLVSGATQAELSSKNIDKTIVPIAPKNIQEKIKTLYIDHHELNKEAKLLLNQAKEKIENIISP